MTITEKYKGKIIKKVSNTGIKKEEFNALRNSLASALEEKGVTITEEDDMASLINKVDNIKSQPYNIQIASTLPEEVENNSLVILTETPGKFNLVTSMPKTVNENDMYLIFKSSPFSKSNVTYLSYADEITFPSFYIYDIKQIQSSNAVRVPGYIGMNNEWVHVNPETIWYDHGNQMTHISGGYTSSCSSTYSGSGVVFSTNCIKMTGYCGNPAVTPMITTVNKIDFSKYSKVAIKYSVTRNKSSNNTNDNLRFYYMIGSTRTMVFSEVNISRDETVLEIDLSNVNSTDTFGIWLYNYCNQTATAGVYVTQIYEIRFVE